MGAKHTPGPWHVDRGQEVYALGSNERRLIADCHAGHRKEREANATLIAAAPELLADCEQLLLVIHDLMPGIGAIAVQDYARAHEAPIAARKAIAKAKGE